MHASHYPLINLVYRSVYLSSHSFHFIHHLAHLSSSLGGGLPLMATLAATVAVVLLAAGVLCSLADAAVFEHTFLVGNLTVNRLCDDKIITTVNKQYPGPTINVIEGDTVVVHVINESPYGMTIHWHGVIQMLNCWADGAGMITQCPIQPGDRMTYQFNVTGQEGTLWWHAHVKSFRATVHGALIIRPKIKYPFTSPDGEATLILGEWYKENILVVEDEIRGSIFSTISEAFTINGKTGDLYDCSSRPEDTYVMDVEVGKTYLLRIINAALNNEFFYKIAGHSFVVVAVDACYTNPHHTDMIVLGPGQTVDALLVADAPPALYYMVATPHATESPTPPWVENTITRGVLRYASIQPLMPSNMPLMPRIHDHAAAYHFYSNLTGLLKLGEHSSVPLDVDERMFITLGIGTICKEGEAWCELQNRLVRAYMNNISFVLPEERSILDAYHNKIHGIYTTDFPEKPPKFYNFTDTSLKFNKTLQLDYLNKTLEFTSEGTKIKKLMYNKTVEIVLQGGCVISSIGHHIHFHGNNFFVVAHGHGNYNQEAAMKSYNLINPPMRNTVMVPVEGWAVIRFVVNNPGVWLFHCHMDLHLSLGMAMVFVVENGPTKDTMLPGPPANLPQCSLDPQMNVVIRDDDRYI